MSMKENVEFIKEELTQEEKFLESSVKAERFFKKYKSIIVGGVSFIVVGSLAYGITNYINDLNKKEANIAYVKAISDNDAKSLETIKKSNSHLYEIAMYKLSKTTNAEFLSDIQKYEKAIVNKDIKILNQLINKKDFLLKDFAIFQKTIILIENKKYVEAKNSIKFIKDNSILKEQITLLKHFLITK